MASSPPSNLRYRTVSTGVPNVGTGHSRLSLLLSRQHRCIPRSGLGRLLLGGSCPSWFLRVIHWLMGRWWSLVVRIMIIYGLLLDVIVMTICGSWWELFFRGKYMESQTIYEWLGLETVSSQMRAWLPSPGTALDCRKHVVRWALVPKEFFEYLKKIPTYFCPPICTSNLPLKDPYLFLSPHLYE